MTYEEVMNWIRESGKKEKVDLKRGVGIVTKNSVGIYHSDLRKKAEEIGLDSALAIKLFDSGVYEARVLCSKIFDPKDLTADMGEKWVRTFENPEICDSFSMGLFAKSNLAVAKAMEWCVRQNRFQKRTGFTTLVAYCRVNREAENDVFEAFLPLIKKEANDNRPQVKHAIDWALRSIGRRNIDLQKAAISTAYHIIQHGNKPAKWVGRKALGILQSDQTILLNYPEKIYNPTKSTDSNNERAVDGTPPDTSTPSRSNS